jgi:hypothetical protein
MPAKCAAIFGNIGERRPDAITESHDIMASTAP